MVFRTIEIPPPPNLERHDQVLPILVQCAVGFFPQHPCRLHSCHLECFALLHSHVNSYLSFRSQLPLWFIHVTFFRPFQSKVDVLLVLPFHVITVITLLYSYFPFKLVNSFKIFSLYILLNEW